MSDITATVDITSNDVVVTAVGIQGSSAVLGPDSTLNSIGNVDAVNPVNGSLLIYKTGTSKWTASTTLDAQNMEGGEF
jgi:hypothetical protein